MWLLVLGALVFWWAVRALHVHALRHQRRCEQACPHGYANWDDCPDCRH